MTLVKVTPSSVLLFTMELWMHEEDGDKDPNGSSESGPKQRAFAKEKIIGKLLVGQKVL